MRAIWTGAIGFGLVNIPVKVYSATNQDKLNFEMLDKSTHSKIRYARISTATDKEIPFEDIVKGYKLGDEYVIVDNKDFEKVAPEKNKTIEILDFVEEADVDSIYYEKPYFLEPDKTAGRSYALLRDALTKSKKVGIAIFVLRNKQHIGVLKASGKALIFNQIRFAHEVRDPQELNLPAEQIAKGKEMEMALNLIEQSTTSFKAENYKDDYTERLLKIIEQKAKGKTIKTPKGKPVKGTKPDELIELLKASLTKRKEARRGKAKETAKK